MQTISTHRYFSVSWGAVLAGSAFAAALYYFLLVLGFGLGVPAISPWSNSMAGGTPGTAMASTANRGAHGSSYYLDSMLRSSSEAHANYQSGGDVHADLWSFLFRDLIAGTLSSQDYRHAVQLASSQTGLTQQNAQVVLTTIVDEARLEVSQAEQQALEAAELNRKSSVFSMLRLLVALLCGSFFASLMTTFSGRQRSPV